MEEAPVYPVALAEGDITALPDPAAETVEEKQQNPLACGVDVHGDLSLLNEIEKLADDLVGHQKAPGA